MRNSLDISPPHFSLANDGNMTITYRVKNPTRKIIRLNYPTAQRFDIAVKDANGEEIERWSENRVFNHEEGIIFLNPGEHLEYKEKISTAKLTPTERYSVLAEVPDNPGFEVTKTLHPKE